MVACTKAVIGEVTLETQEMKGGQCVEAKGGHWHA
jgi:hypothetical protein